MDDGRSGERVVCFDLGGVLVRICRSWPEACERAGLELREPSDPEERQRFAREREAISSAYQLGHLDERSYYAQLARTSAGLYAPEDVERIHHAWTFMEYAGVDALVAELDAMPGLRLACLSNTNCAHWRRLAPDAPAAEPEYPSLARLHIMLASHLLGIAKPDPEIYRVAQQTFGVPAERIVFFDDLPGNVRAARAAGWAAEPIDPCGDPVAQIRRHLARHGVPVAPASAGGDESAP